MPKLPLLGRLRLIYLTWRNRGSLQRRFIIRVLAPPFFILLLLGVVGLLQINTYISNRAVDELDRSADSTAAKIEREFAIRQTILKRTGEDLFKIKDDFQKGRQALDKNRAECSAYVRQKKTYAGAPAGSCEPFLVALASRGINPKVIEDHYVEAGTGLIQSQEQKLQDRLSAFNQFFPETRVLLISDDNQKPVSVASSGDFNASTDIFQPMLRDVGNQPAEGKIMVVNGLRLAVFAYPIQGGSVLAAYDLDSNGFVKQTWAATPIDRSKSLAIILDESGDPAYPLAAINFKDISGKLRTGQYAAVDIKGVPHVAVGTEAGASGWLVVVASPQAVVFGPMRDARLAATVVIGLLLTGFLWVGAIFIKRTVGTIENLVGGAMLFAGGKLDNFIQLEEADKEFAQLAESMNIMAWRIADAEKQLDVKNKEFISIATHELRTPLTAILGNLSMAVEDYGDDLDKKVKPIIEQAHNGTLRLRDLVNDMLDMARLDGGRVEFVIEKQDIGKIIQEVVDTLQITAKDQHVHLKYKPAGAVAIMADLSKLRIVINNFVSNAIKYNKPGGDVTVSHTLKDGKLTTAVADTGLGIPEEQKAHIFEKFFRVSNADRQNVTGTGLGMYITRRYIMSMGGQVWFESTHGKGTTFYFSLPLAPKPALVKPAATKPVRHKATPKAATAHL